jgi:hypothetical protein
VRLELFQRDFFARGDVGIDRLAGGEPLILLVIECSSDGFQLLWAVNLIGAFGQCAAGEPPVYQRFLLGMCRGGVGDYVCALHDFCKRHSGRDTRGLLFKFCHGDAEGGPGLAAIDHTVGDVLDQKRRRGSAKQQLGGQGGGLSCGLAGGDQMRFQAVEHG